MPNQNRPRTLRQNTDITIRGRARSSSPLAFFRSASACSLLRFRSKPVVKGENSNSNISIDSVLTVPSHDTEDIDDNNNQDEALFDVLPSFQMYNALHKHIPRGNVCADYHDSPPSYQTLNETELNGRVQSLMVSDSISSRSNSCFNLQSLPTQYMNLLPSNLNEEPIEDDIGDQDYENINIEKLYSLPKLATPVDIDIRITKHAVKSNVRPQEESILKEYTSGNIINGYIVIENRSSHHLKFEMFYVTLEGYSTIIDKVNGKRIIKRFLRMVDLSASWSYSFVDTANGYSYSYGSKDYDNCVIGLNNARILEPGVKYKKFFMFKFPMSLLDCTCKHEQYSHGLLPPSFGVDKYKFNGKYDAIKINSLLGYGHLGTKGSSILTNDLVGDTLSINYTIDAKIVGKDAKTGKLNIMRENEYNLRFIPFGYCQLFSDGSQTKKQLDALTNLLKERIAALENVFKRLERNEKIRSCDVQSTDISGTIEDGLEINLEDILNCKMQQSHIGNRLNESYFSVPLRDTKNLFSSNPTVDSEFSYNIKSKKTKKSSILTGISNGNRFSEQKNSLKSGIIMLSAKIPKNGLPYIQPPLIRKVNSFEKKNKNDKKNWKALLEPFSESEKKVLDKVSVNLTCIQSNNGAPHDPPNVVAVNTDLVCLTSKSLNSIPIKFDTNILLDIEEVNKFKYLYHGYLQKVIKLKEKFEKNFKSINELYNLSRRPNTLRKLDFGDFISPQLIHDIESLANLDVDIRILHDVFKDQLSTLKYPENDLSYTNLHSSSSSNILTATFSNSSNSHMNTQQAALFKDQITHEWVKSGEREYSREIDVNLVLNEDIKKTLVPTFESCLCSRMYCIRVIIKFDQAGTGSLDIPVRLRMLEA